MSTTTNAQVHLRIVHNGHAHPVPSGGTVFPSSSDIGLVLFECNEDPARRTPSSRPRSPARRSTSARGRSP